MTTQRFGKYRLKERLAVGGMAEVFKAALVLEDGGERAIVLKRILPQHARDERFHRIFQEEALVVASLQHPNIVQLRDYGEMQGFHYLALEYIEGADLDTLLHRARTSNLLITPPMSATIALEVCSALDYIHTRESSDGHPLGIVHRDVSPHNILVSTDGVVKLADFGIAKSAIRRDRTTEGTLKGKFNYMAPEQATSGLLVDARTDLFALGSVLYQMLFGQPPFRGESDVETLDRVRECSYILDDSWLSETDQPLLRIIEGSLVKDPDGRYASAAVLKQDLQAYLDGQSQAVTQNDLAHWVQTLRQSGETDGTGDLVKGLLGKRYKTGGTAVMSSGAKAQAEGPADRSESIFTKRVPRPSRGILTALLVLLLVVTTAVVTWLVSRHLHRPQPGRPTVAARAASVDTGPGATPMGATVLDASTPDLVAPRPAHQLQVRSRPSGAAVLVDGSSVGKTPLDTEAPQLGFVVSVKRRGYHAWTRRVGAPDRDVRLVARLKRRVSGRGKLTVNSIPWARVYLDGRYLGTTPLRAVEVPAGSHRIVLKSHEGKTLRSFVTRIPSGDTKVFSFDRANP
jgi:serine/threonine-protein kinase